MEFSGESWQKRLNFLSQGFAGLIGKGAPMVFGVLPEDFDGVQFGAVGQQIQRQKAMLDQPAVGNGRINVVMHRRIVHNEEGPLVSRGALAQER